MPFWHTCLVGASLLLGSCREASEEKEKNEKRSYSRLAPCICQKQNAQQQEEAIQVFLSHFIQKQKGLFKDNWQSKKKTTVKLTLFIFYSSQSAQQQTNDEIPLSNNLERQLESKKKKRTQNRPKTIEKQAKANEISPFDWKRQPTTTPHDSTLLIKAQEVRRDTKTRKHDKNTTKNNQKHTLDLQKPTPYHWKRLRTPSAHLLEEEEERKRENSKNTKKQSKTNKKTPKHSTNKQKTNTGQPNCAQHIDLRGNSEQSKQNRTKTNKKQAKTSKPEPQMHPRTQKTRIKTPNTSECTYLRD